MRPSVVILAALLYCPSVALAQTPVPGAPTPPPGAQVHMQFEGITLGEPLAALTPRLGDPIQIASTGKTVIWRYLEGGGGYYVDLVVKNNTAASVTVVQRMQGARYTDPHGVSFGMTSDQVRAKLGAPWRVTTNSDDGSVDLWYRVGDYAWIYEFYSDKLGFVQLIAAPAVAVTFVDGPPVATNDGAALESAIKIRPSTLIFSSIWIDAYLAMNRCGNGGHWKETSLNHKPDDVTKDPLAYTIVHVRCTDGGAERAIYFDTRGAATPDKNGNSTFYVDPSQLPRLSPSPAPH